MGANISHDEHTFEFLLSCRDSHIRNHIVSGNWARPNSVAVASVVRLFPILYTYVLVVFRSFNVIRLF